jgi:hypothetical protein
LSVHFGQPSFLKLKTFYKINKKLKMLGDIKLGVLSDDEVHEILNVIRYEEQLLFLKKTDNNEYYLTVQSNLFSSEENQYIYTPFFDCYFVDLYCPSFVFITYSKKRDCFVASKDTEGCEKIEDDVDEIFLPEDDHENLYTGIYEILTLDNAHLEESEQIEIVKNFIKNYSIKG